MKPEESKISLEPLSPEERSSFATIFAVTSQIALNALQRNAFGVGKFRGNTGGEKLSDVAAVLREKPSLMLGGLESRFKLQLLTQGLPTIKNRLSPSGEQISPGIISALMTTLGVYFEAKGLEKPTRDKAAKFNIPIDKTSHEFLKAAAPAIAIPMWVRNTIYAKTVFGGERPLEERCGIAAVVGSFTTPFDNFLNEIAYVSGTAQEPSIVDAYKKTWAKFTASEVKGDPYARFMQSLKINFNGVGLRIPAVAGATFLLAKENTTAIEEAITPYTRSVGKFFEMLGNEIEARGGFEKESLTGRPAGEIARPVAMSLKGSHTNSGVEV